MKVVVTIQHPGHVHFFRHAIDRLQDDGHEVHVFARASDVTADLLAAYDIPHRMLAGEADSLASLAAVQARYEFRLLRAARRIEPDVITAIGGIAAAHVAAVVGARSVVFTDTEHATLINALAFPLADVVGTPASFRKDLGDKQVRYEGFHELAYLHPNRFTPDPSVLDGLDVDEDDPLVVMRLVSWGASHDVGQGGFGDIRDAVDRLEAQGATVVLTSETSLPPELESRRYRLPPHRIHHLLYYADLFVGEGATMAIESAVLGTPALYVNTLDAGCLSELETDYGLLFGFSGEDRHERALERAESVLANPDTGKWERRRGRLLTEKEDTTGTILDLIRGDTAAVPA
ncbi:DUF354 domain-containing protein [Halobacteriaceae archaeon GCM10025711]